MVNIRTIGSSVQFISLQLELYVNKAFVLNERRKLSCVSTSCASVKHVWAAVDVVEKRSLQAVVSRSDSDNCVTRLVGQMTSLSLGQLTNRPVGMSAC